MARFWAMWSVGLALLLALLIGAAGMVGRARGGITLAYYVDSSTYNPRLAGTYLLDLPSGVRQFMRGCGILEDASLDRDTLLLSCDNLNALLLWNGLYVRRVVDLPFNAGFRPVPSPNGDIAFAGCDPRCKLFVWDGETVRELLEIVTPINHGIVWGVDGHLYFSAQQYSGGNESYSDIIMWDGDTFSNLTNTATANERFLEFSNRGLLAISSCNRAEVCDILIWDGNQLSNLTHTTDMYEGGVHWSNRGELAFVQCPIETYICDVIVWDGTHTRNITNTPNLDEHYIEGWSSDGRLVFSQCVDWNSCDLMLWDGETITNLTNSADIGDRRPVWNDVGQFVFQACSDRCDLMLWDGETVINLTNSPDVDDREPVWSGTGQLAFRACVDGGVNDICDLMLWDGASITTLTHTPTLNEYAPVWLP